MRSRVWMAMAVPVMLMLLAVAGAAYLLATRETSPVLIAGALAALAIAQIFVITMLWPRLAEVGERMALSGRTVRDLASQVAAGETRTARLESTLADLRSSPQDGLAAELRALREQVTELSRKVAVRPAAEPPRPQPAPEQPAARAAERPASPRDSLDLLLQPVIELNSGATLHYRAELAMNGEGGAAASHDQIMGKAEAGGLRGALENHMLKLALPVIRRLRQRHPNMRVFLPVGAATLNTGSDFVQLVDLLESNTDAAAGVVFDLRQSDIARLSATGIEALARLGRLGIVTALSGVAATGTDLVSLRQLGARYLIAAAGNLDTDPGAGAVWRQFSHQARGLQFQLIAADVETAQQASAATRIARFGYGPFFAPARRVKREAGETFAARHERAA